MKYKAQVLRLAQVSWFPCNWVRWTPPLPPSSDPAMVQAQCAHPDLQEG